MIRLYFLLLAMIFLTACSSYKMEYGVTSKTGVTFYPLCERSQQRITDLNRVSFVFSAYIKQQPCRNWPDYSHSRNFDKVSISLPAKIYSGDNIVVGGTLGLEVIARNYKKNWHYYSDPVRMLEDYVIAIYKYRSLDDLPNQYSRVERAGMSCLRLALESDNLYLRRRSMDYFCWETISGYPYPIHLRAWERLPTGSSGGSDFEKLLIEPVLDSMEIYPADPEILAQYHTTRAQKCHDAKLFYDTRGAQGTGIGGGLGSSRTNNYLRDCGYEVDDMPRVESMHELIFKDSNVIGTPGSEQHLRVFDDFAFTNSSVYRRHKNKRYTEDVRLLSKEEFYTLKEMLLVFRPRIITPWFDYPGDWYSYATRPDGNFGFRHHAEFGEVIDMTDRFDSHPRLSFIIAQ